MTRADDLKDSNELKKSYEEYNKKQAEIKSLKESINDKKKK